MPVSDGTALRARRRGAVREVLAELDEWPGGRGDPVDLATEIARARRRSDTAHARRALVALAAAAIAHLERHDDSPG